jgi:hypothetical protein
MTADARKHTIRGEMHNASTLIRVEKRQKMRERSVEEKSRLERAHYSLLLLDRSNSVNYDLWSQPFYYGFELRKSGGQVDACVIRGARRSKIGRRQGSHSSVYVKAVVGGEHLHQLVAEHAASP